MTGLTIRKTIELNYTADQWELYDGAGREEAAQELNRAVTEAVNTSTTSSEAFHKITVSGVFEKYVDLGARDSEPLNHLDWILEKVFAAR